MRVRKINFESLYFLLCVTGIVLLAWVLKNFIKAGDEVIAGISAALITLLGVKLTNNNSQIALDKQLKHQGDTFQAQMKDQADGFVEQMKHQSDLLERQMKHQSEENDKERKQKFKHDQYIKLIDGLSEVQGYFTSDFMLSYDPTELPKKLSFLKAKFYSGKMISSSKIAKQLDEIHSKYFEFVSKLSSEARKLDALNQESEHLKRSLSLIQGNAEKLYNQIGLSKVDNENLDIIIAGKQELVDKISKNNKEIINEINRLLIMFKPNIEEIKLLTAVIVMLINIELGYSEMEEY